MTDHTSRTRRTLTVEHRGTEHIEENQRRGRPVNQFTRRQSLARQNRQGRHLAAGPACKARGRASKLTLSS
jgi:hypothetical protein